MKCQKCHAENISEAVKCGICGARLKHPKTSDDFTGSQHVQSSIRRENKKQDTFNPNPNIKPSQKSHSNQSQSITDQIFDKNTKIEDKVRILLDSWQDKAKGAWGSHQTKSKRESKNKNWVFIVVAIFIFASPVISLITNVLIPEIYKQVHTHFGANDVGEADVMQAVTEDNENSEAAREANKYENRYYEMQSYQAYVEEMYHKTKVLPKNLHDIEKFDDVEFDEAIHRVIKIKDGMIIGLIHGPDDQRIYLKPEINNQTILGWNCYKVGISDAELSECTQEPTGSTAPITE